MFSEKIWYWHLHSQPVRQTPSGLVLTICLSKVSGLPVVTWSPSRPLTCGSCSCWLYGLMPVVSIPVSSTITYTSCFVFKALESVISLNLDSLEKAVSTILCTVVKDLQFVFTIQKKRKSDSSNLKTFYGKILTSNRRHLMLLHVCLEYYVSWLYYAERRWLTIINYYFVNLRMF